MSDAIDEPPNAAAVAPTTVMPICTVARKPSGLARSSATDRAPGFPSATSSASRVFRSDTIAISAPEKIPFTRTRTRMMKSSVSNGISRASGNQGVGS